MIRVQRLDRWAFRSVEAAVRRAGARAGATFTPPYGTIRLNTHSASAQVNQYQATMISTS